MADTESEWVRNLYIGVALLIASVTPTWLATMYQVADDEARAHFWTLARLPAFIPSVLALVLCIAILRGWPLPGMRVATASVSVVPTPRRATSPRLLAGLSVVVVVLFTVGLMSLSTKGGLGADLARSIPVGVMVGALVYLAMRPIDRARAISDSYGRPSPEIAHAVWQGQGIADAVQSGDPNGQADAWANMVFSLLLNQRQEDEAAAFIAAANGAEPAHEQMTKRLAELARILGEQ